MYLHSDQRERERERENSKLILILFNDFLLLQVQRIQFYLIEIASYKGGSRIKETF